MKLSTAFLLARCPMHPATLIGGCVLASLIAFSPPVAAQISDSEEIKAGQSASQGKERQRSSDDKGSDKAEKAPDDLESCKRDADGMRGPERSRFMTACLRERK